MDGPRQNEGEEARLAVLEELGVLDTPPEQEYDDLVTLAAAICRTPVAILNLVARERQWGKAMIGCESTDAPRDVSICSRTIQQPEGLLVIGDLLLDPRYADNPFVTDADPPVRFYAGAAVETEDGHRLGSVCVVDHVPRELDAEQLAALLALARQAGAQFDLRRRTRALETANAELRHLALHDPLTGLPNRTLVHDRLLQAVTRARRSGRPVGVLFCDLDGFKAVNDEYGHDRGDDLLCAVAARLTEATRASDTVGRLAGDEFVVVCDHIADDEHAAVLIDRLVDAVCRPFGDLFPRISIGAAVWRSEDTPASLLKRADAAMYVTKSAA